MNTHVSSRTKRIAWLFALLYFSSYLMRINFAVMLVRVISDMGSTKSALSIVITALTLTYGAGQILSGLLGDRLNPRHLLTAGLSLASVCNVAMFFCTTVPAMTAVWAVNGLAHALLWPPIVRLMSTHLPDAEYGYAAVRVSWGSSIATILLYLLCPLLLHAMPWRYVMLLCAAFGILVTLFWALVNRRLFEGTQRERVPVSSAPAVTHPVPRYVYLPIALILLAIILQGMLRDGVTNWMPSYLLESFSLSEENAIVSTVVLALFSMLSFFLFDRLHRMLFKNEVFCAAMIFALSTLASLILYPVNLYLSSPIPSMLLMAIVVGSMHGINLMLISVVPKRFLKSGRVSTYSGLLNAGTYVGAALSSWGFATLAERFGWSVTILSWVLISALGTAVCLLTAPLWKRFRNDWGD